MILADTSVWADHLRTGDATLIALLEAGSVLGHPWLRGELAMGNLRDREGVLRRLALLTPAIVADDVEVLGMIEVERLWGTGLGWVDAGLLASARLSDARLWTRDRRLAAAAARLGVGAGP